MASGTSGGLLGVGRWGGRGCGHGVVSARADGFTVTDETYRATTVVKLTKYKTAGTTLLFVPTYLYVTTYLIVEFLVKPL